MEPELNFAGSICRICLQLSLNRYDIVLSGLQYLFREFTGIQIKSDDGLPTVMCPTCVYLLNKAVRFRRKCFDSNIYLCDFLHSGQTEFDVDKSQRPPYLTLNVSETVICEVPSTTCDKVKVEYENAVQNVFHGSDCIDIIPDFEPFDVNGATIGPLPSDICPTTPKPIQNSKRKRQRKVKKKNEEESLKTAIANMQDMDENRFRMQVPLNYDGVPDINKYFSICNNENGQPEYVQKELHQSDVAENASVEEVLTIDESCLYTLKPQFKELTKYFKAQDGTAISTCSLIGPRYLRVEHLTLNQQLEVMEKQRNSEKYLTSPFKCESCALSFPLEYPYKKHMRKHSVSAGPFQCSICKVRMVGRQGLQRHNNSHRLRFVCVLCGARLRSRSIHSKHVMIKHIGMPEMLCLLCNKRYKNPLTFHSHNLRQHSNSLLQCPHCPESFKWRTTFYTHIADKHTGALPYPCNKCSKSFAQLSRLRQHKLYVHDKQKLLCEHCKLALPCTSYLEKHLLKGCSKPKNYYALECDQCSEVFTRPSLQRYHKALVHDHQFRCDICEISFPSLKHLERHNARGHKTSCCPHCKKRFNNDIGLGIHIRRAHNVNRKILRRFHKPASGTNGTNMKVDISHLLTTQATNVSNCSGQMSQIVKSNRAKRKCLEVPKDTITTIPIKNCDKHLAHCRIHAIDCGYKFTNFCFKKENGKFICDFCENSYETRMELEKHVHPDPILCCKFCQSKFSDYHSISLHLRLKHPDKLSIILRQMCNCILKIPSMSVLSVKPVENDHSESPVNIDTDITKNDQTEHKKRVYKIKLKNMVPVSTSMFTSQCMDLVESDISDVMPKEFVTSFETYNVQIPYPIPTTSIQASNLPVPTRYFRGRSLLKHTNPQSPRHTRGTQKQIRKYTTMLQNNKFTEMLKDKLGLQLQISKPCGRKETTAKISNLLTLVPITNYQQNPKSISTTSKKSNSSVILEGKSKSNIDQQSTKELLNPSSSKSKVDVSAQEHNTKSTTLDLEQTDLMKDKQGSQIDHKGSPGEIDTKNMSENENQGTNNMSSSLQKITLSEWLKSNLKIPKSTQHATKAINTIPMPSLVPISFPRNEAQKIVSITPSLVPIDAKKETLQEISTNLQKSHSTRVPIEKNARICLKLSNTNEPPSSKQIEKKSYDVAELHKTLKTMEKGNHKILLEHNLWGLLNPQDKSQLLAFIKEIRDLHPTKSIMFVKINSEIHAYTLMRNTTNEEKVVRLLPIPKFKMLESGGEMAAEMSLGPKFKKSEEKGVNVDSRPASSKLQE